MGRRKAERIIVPDGDFISRKAMKSSEFTFWGSEPKWSPRENYIAEAKEEWTNQTVKLRQLRYNNITDHDCEWFQLTQEEQDLIVDAEISNQMARSLNWYNSMTDCTKMKKYFMDYCVDNYPDNIEALEKVPEAHFHTIGALVRMFSRGFLLARYQNKIPEFIEKYGRTVKKEVLEREKIVPKYTNLEPRVRNFIGHIDLTLDKFFSSDSEIDGCLADFVLSNGGTNTERLRIHEYFTRMATEIGNTLAGDDKDLLEAYGNISKERLRNVYEWLTGTATEELVLAAKTTRKKRKKKVKTVAQLLKHFKCKESDPETGVVSIDAENIIGVQQLWVYNTKTRKLGVFNSCDASGLSVSRTSITNFVEDTSVCKKIRKPHEVIPSIVTAGKVALRHLMDNIKAVQSQLKSRINEDTVLLRVIK